MSILLRSSFLVLMLTKVSMWLTIGWVELGYQAHGAIVHYEATPETDIPLKPEGLLLLDSCLLYTSLLRLQRDRSWRWAAILSSKNIRS